MKIISGAQTGIDRAALDAAKKCGLETGGWMPNGFIALDGKHPKFAKLYGIQETTGSLYKQRTYLNVRDSNGTLRLWMKKSPGEICTEMAIDFYSRPNLSIRMNQLLPAREVVEWIEKNNIEILNVAGHSEKTYPGSYDIGYKYLLEIFKCLTN